MAWQSDPDEARLAAAVPPPAPAMNSSWQATLAKADAMGPVVPLTAEELALVVPAAEDQVAALAALCSRLTMQVQCLEHEVRAIKAGMRAYRLKVPPSEPEPEAPHDKQLCPCGCWVDEGARRHCVIAGCPAK